MKVLIYSHSKDIDGLGGVILAELAFNDLDYKLFPNPRELCEQVVLDLAANKYSLYDKVFITDLTLEDPAISLVNQNEVAKSRMTVFDHHHTAVEGGYHLYDFVEISVSDDSGTLNCGSKLFYEYLTREGYLKATPALDDLVEKIRLEDTWDWKKSDNGIEAHNLAILQSEIGNELFISHMIDTVKRNPNQFKLSIDDRTIIETKIAYNDSIINNLLISMEYFIDKQGNRFGAVFSTHEYVNDLAQKIRDLNNPNNIAYIMVVCLDSNSRSYRSIDYANFNVAQIAVSHGGGGQFAAAGAGLNEIHKQKILTMNKRESLEFLSEAYYEV